MSGDILEIEFEAGGTKVKSQVLGGVPMLISIYEEGLRNVAFDYQRIKTVAEMGNDDAIAFMSANGLPFINLDDLKV